MHAYERTLNRMHMYKSRPKLLSPSLSYPSRSLSLARSLSRSLSGLLYVFLRLPEYTNKFISCIAEYVTQHVRPRRSWPRRTVQAGGKKRTSLSWPERGNFARQASSPSLPPSRSLPPSPSPLKIKIRPIWNTNYIHYRKRVQSFFSRAHKHTQEYLLLDVTGKEPHLNLPSALAVAQVPCRWQPLPSSCQLKKKRGEQKKERGERERIRV